MALPELIGKENYRRTVIVCDIWNIRYRDGGCTVSKGYDLLGLYHDAGDPRVIVPKRVKALGWTINVGHQRGRLALAGVGVAILIAAALQYG